MRLSFADAFSSAFDAARGFRWTEYAPFFWILAVQLVFLALTTQLEHAWAMAAVAPVISWVGGAGALHYPTLFGFLSVAMGWVESFLYAVPGSLLIPMAILRIYARTDRALSLGAGAASRLAGALLPTLLASLAGVGCVWGWQQFGAPTAAPFIRQALPGGLGGFAGWAVTVLGGYVVISLLLYVPVAAVQARTNMGRALVRGIRFGFRALPLTCLIAILFGLPAIGVQFILERQGSFILTKLRPEVMAVALGVYATLTSFATYFTYSTVARLYRMARGED